MGGTPADLQDLRGQWDKLALYKFFGSQRSEDGQWFECFFYAGTQGVLLVFVILYETSQELLGFAVIVCNIVLVEVRKMLL